MDIGASVSNGGTRSVCEKEDAAKAVSGL